MYDPKRLDFIIKLVQLQNEAGELKLWRTMHALAGATEQYARDVDPNYAKARQDEK